MSDVLARCFPVMQVLCKGEHHSFYLGGIDLAMRSVRQANGFRTWFEARDAGWDVRECDVTVTPKEKSA